MNERPILFSAPMVRAILSGEKTVTRRVVKGQYLEGPWSVRPATESRTPLHSHDWWLPTGSQPYTALRPCPYGKAGDRLWVRESWQVSEKYDRVAPSDIPWWRGVSTYFAAGGSRAHDASGAYVNDDTICVPNWVGRMRPSIHMPRLASRIMLEITSISVERLQDIRDEQVMVEGVHKQPTTGWYSVPGIDGAGTTPRSAFANLWNSTGGDWDANPWVWAVEFKVVQ